MKILFFYSALNFSDFMEEESPKNQIFGISSLPPYIF